MKTFNSTEAAAFLKVSVSSLGELAMDGTIPAAKIGRSWVFTEQHLAEYLIQQIEQQTAERRDLLNQGKPTKIKTAISSRKALPVLPELPDLTQNKRRRRYPDLPLLPDCNTAH